MMAGSAAQRLRSRSSLCTTWKKEATFYRAVCGYAKEIGQG